MVPIAESAALAAVGWVASPVLKILVDKCIDLLGTDIAKEFEDLETTLLPQFQLTIDAAQQSPHKDWVTKWRNRLEKAYSDAHKILLELQEYERLQSSTRRSYFWSFFTRKMKLYPQKMKLLKQLNKLKRVAAQAKDLRDLLAIAGNKRNVPTTANFAYKYEYIFGRKGDRDEIIKFLLNEQVSSSSLRNYSVVAITGMIDAGKTTLAQYVLNDPRVKDLFKSGVTMWLDLSQNFDIHKYTKEMIEFTTKRECPKFNLSMLQDELKKTLPKNILVVLDGVSYDNNDRDFGEKQWECLLTPFANLQLEGTCKIVVTSRSSSFPIALRPDKKIELSDLAPDHFKSLLKHHAIDCLKISNPQLMRDLTHRNHIVDLISEKMVQSPYAAKVVGSELCKNPDITFWEDYLEKVNHSFRRIVYFSESRQLNLFSNVTLDQID